MKHRSLSPQLIEFNQNRTRLSSWEDVLEKDMAPHSSILVWEIPWTGVWWATGHGITKSQIQLSDSAYPPVMLSLWWRSVEKLGEESI